VDDGGMACIRVVMALGVFRSLGFPLAVSLGYFELGRNAIQTGRSCTVAPHPGFTEPPS
jgi:hypothetical protein